MQKALLVEDDSVMAALWRHVIHQVIPEARIETVETGEKAELLLTKGRYDLVVSDIFLKGKKTGLDLWQTIASQSIPFVLTSAISKTWIGQTLGGAVPVPPYVQKPFHFRTGAQTIRNVLFSKKPSIRFKEAL